MSRAKGYIKNVNTIEEFKNIDKSAMITDAGRQVCIHVISLALVVNTSGRYGRRSKMAPFIQCPRSFLPSPFSRLPT